MLIKIKTLENKNCYTMKTILNEDNFYVTHFEFVKMNK